MGMLDEAIREHFDLMRRNGADPAVIAIEEREALGDPAQREARAAEEVGGGEEGTHVEAVVVSAEADGVAVAEVADEELPAESGETTEVDVLVVSEEAGAVVVEEDHVVEEVAAVEELPAEPPGQETRAFTVEESQDAVMPGRPDAAPPAGAPPAADEVANAPAVEASSQEAADEARDELEETPEFLEETPEHDRLWFERKPPRDFDF